jgi:hypothetical protein
MNREVYKWNISVVKCHYAIVIVRRGWLVFWCLTPLSTIFQLNRGGVRRENNTIVEMCKTGVVRFMIQDGYCVLQSLFHRTQCSGLCIDDAFTFV